jgi:hypothetical protein
MVKTVYDELAHGMQNVMADEDYQKIFAKPKIATASVKEQVKLSADGILDTFGTLVIISGMLDDLGLSKSAMQLLKAAHMLEEELVPQPAAKESEDDLEDLLRDLGDINDAMDKPKDEDDKKEGNPEKC